MQAFQINETGLSIPSVIVPFSITDMQDMVGHLAQILSRMP